MNPFLAEKCRRNYWEFSKVIFSRMEETPFHKTYYTILDKFAKGEIKKLIISVSPQHGKSEGSSRLLPPYVLGLNPAKKIAIASYASTLANSFNKAAQRYMLDPNYKEIFEGTRITENGQKSDRWQKTADFVEVIDTGGYIKTVGRGGPLTGSTVDLMIIDDLYKDFAEANSPIIRAAAWNWYTDVVKSRLHNESQELIVFTRWHEDDLIGRIEELEPVITINKFSDIEKIKSGEWAKVNFQAIKESEPSEIDPREKGTALWEARHGIEMLRAKRKLAPLRFDCLYQGEPESAEGLLYSTFKTYETLPNTKAKKAMIDTADQGDDHLAAVAYEIGINNYIYIKDIYYTDEAMEKTEPETIKLLDRNDTRICKIESNNGGRGFARVIAANVRSCKIKWYHQSKNKESRILTNAPTVTQKILFPVGWQDLWPEFYTAITKYKRLFKANKFDDAADVLTAIIENEYKSNKKRIL